MPTTPVLNDRQKIAALPVGTIFLFHADAERYSNGDYVLPYVKAEGGVRPISSVVSRLTIVERCDNATERIVSTDAFPMRWRFTVVRYGLDGEVHHAL